MKRKIRLVGRRLASFIFPTSQIAKQLLGEGSLHLEMVQIPPGVFCMGTDTLDSTVWPAHQVSINYAFEIGKYKVTQGQWEAVMGINPSHINSGVNNRSVDSVSYEDALRFIKLLNSLTKRDYRLPTEAEWEYACCARDEKDISCNDVDPATSSVPSSPANANIFGLYNTNCELWEWVEDYYHEDYLGAPVDGSAWRTTRGGKFGRDRVLRGALDGTFKNGFSLARNHFIPRGRSSSFSFRLARTIATTPPAMES